mgnify:CR=1 FL=1
MQWPACIDHAFMCTHINKYAYVFEIFVWEDGGWQWMVEVNSLKIAYLGRAQFETRRQLSIAYFTLHYLCVGCITERMYCYCIPCFQSVDVMRWYHWAPWGEIFFANRVWNYFLAILNRMWRCGILLSQIVFISKHLVQSELVVFVKFEMPYWRSRPCTPEKYPVEFPS